MEQEKFQEIMLEQMAKVTQEITVLRQEMTVLRQGMAVIEKDMHDKFGVVFDFINTQTVFNKQVEERFDRLEGKVDGLEQKVDELDGKVDRLVMETAHVRLVK